MDFCVQVLLWVQCVTFIPRTGVCSAALVTDVGVGGEVWRGEARRSVALLRFAGPVDKGIRVSVKL